MAISSAYSSDVLVPLELLRPQIQDNFAVSKLVNYPLFQAIQKESAYQTSIDWGVNPGGAAAYGRSTGEAVSTNNLDVSVEATLPIGKRVIAHSFTLELPQIVQASRIAPAAIQNLYASKIRSAKQAIMDRLTTILYTADGTDDNINHGIVGIDKALDNTYAYAGIPVATYPTWSCAVNTNATARALTSDILFAMDVQLANKEANYTFTIMSPEILAKYKKAFEGRLAVDQVNGRVDLGLGGGGLVYNDRPILQDHRMPNKGKIYFVNGEDVILHSYDLSAAMGSLSGRMYAASMVTNVDGLNVLFAQLPQMNPHSITYEVSVQVQLQIANRRSVAVIDNLITA